MSKLKTRKAVSKRFKVTAKKKVLKRAARQNHFNARQSADHRRNKRTDCLVSGKPAKNILEEV